MPPSHVAPSASNDWDQYDMFGRQIRLAASVTFAAQYLK
ncbi:hypothetical protein FOFC_08127 [Fusarium oxysporum]|nr:hypothetical protein FOFC_08127 [Fusarium oxysporum]